jgi:tetratricopeptide (TPR) repeat protein
MLLAMALVCLVFPVGVVAVTPDKGGSDAAYQRGLQADLGDLKQAFRLDPSNGESEKLLAQAQKKADNASPSAPGGTPPDCNTVAETQKLAVPAPTWLAETVWTAQVWREERDTVVIKLPGALPLLAPIPREESSVQIIPAKTAKGYFTQGQRLVEDVHYAQAIDVLTLALKLDPRMAPAFNKRGFARLKSRQYREAIADLSQAIRLNPEYGNAYLSRALARRATGDLSGAGVDQNRGLELSGEPVFR